MVNNKKIFGFRPSCRAALHQLMPETYGVPPCKTQGTLLAYFGSKGAEKLPLGMITICYCFGNVEVKMK